MTDLLCPANRCRTRGSHQPGCSGCNCPTDGQHRAGCTSCDGCLPRRLADGWYLCRWHGESIGIDAMAVAELYGELELVLIGGGGFAERTSGSRDHGLALNDDAVDMRDEIRAVLTAWVKLVMEDRGVGAPEPHERALAGFIVNHNEWLARQPFAFEAVDELADLRRRAWTVTYPNGTKRFVLCGCPKPGCGGMVQAIVRPKDSLLPASVHCQQDETHAWPSWEWEKLRPETPITPRLGRHRSETPDMPIVPYKVSWDRATTYTELLLSVDDVANTLGCSTRKVRKMIRDGALVPRLVSQRPGIIKGRKAFWFTRSGIHRQLNGYGDQSGLVLDKPEDLAV